MLVSVYTSTLILNQVTSASYLDYHSGQWVSWISDSDPVSTLTYIAILHTTEFQKPFQVTHYMYSEMLIWNVVSHENIKLHVYSLTQWPKSVAINGYWCWSLTVYKQLYVFMRYVHYFKLAFSSGDLQLVDHYLSCTTTYIQWLSR